MKALKEALATKITGDAALMAICTGGAHDMLAPRGTRAPYLLVQWLDSAPSWTLKKRIAEEYRFQAKVVDEGLDVGAAVDPGKDRLEALLDNQLLTVTGKVVWVMRKTGDIPDYAEIDNAGRELVHGGQTYKVVVA